MRRTSYDYWFSVQILIHPTYSYPEFTVGSFALSIGSSNFLNVQPAITYATDNVRSLAISRRNCVFSDEIKLHNFKEYSYQNCLVECRMNITRALCGCISFYYANSDGKWVSGVIRALTTLIWDICYISHSNCLRSRKINKYY